MQIANCKCNCTQNNTTVQRTHDKAYHRVLYIFGVDDRFHQIHGNATLNRCTAISHIYSTRVYALYYVTWHRHATPHHGTNRQTQFAYTQLEVCGTSLSLSLSISIESAGKVFRCECEWCALFEKATETRSLMDGEQRTKYPKEHPKKRGGWVGGVGKNI